jgi:allantoin racemase
VCRCWVKKGVPMHLLLINPNTTAAITDLVHGAAQAIASPGTHFTAATGRFGARYITTRAASAIAAHAALDAYALHGAGVDGVILACFGDPGLAGLKELSPVPVVGMAEAACLAAAPLGRRFSIVTGGERWGPMLEEFVASLGLGSKLAGVATVAPSGGDIARAPQAAYDLLVEACNRCVATHGAEAIILGGAGLAGIAAKISARVPVPLIDGVTAAVKAAEGLVALQVVKAKSGSYALTPATQTHGLSAPLAALLAQQQA